MRTGVALLLALVGCLAACERRSAPAAGDAGTAHQTTSPTADADAVSSNGSSTPDVDAGPRVWPVWTARITDEEEFLHYSTAVGSDRYLKLVVDLHTKATYYADSDLYPMHKDFIFAEILKTPRTPEAVQAFDKNYGKDKPNFLLLYVVHHAKQDLWSLALWEGDKATAAHVRVGIESLKKTFFAAGEVKFRPGSNDQEVVARELANEIGILSNDALYKALDYQSFHRGVAVGKLRVVRGDARKALFSPDEIVILPEPLPDITPVAGILSESFSTPLSHVNLRAAAWDIPNAGMRGATKAFGALDGKIVRYEAGPLGADVRAATESEIAAFTSAKRALGEVRVPKANLSVVALAPLDALHARDASAYGSKTANLGEIVTAKLPGVDVPPGFGVPVAHYARHLEAAGLKSEIERLLADPGFKASAAARKTALEGLRQKIQDAPLQPELVTALGEALTTLTADAGVDAGVFVRSSTNAEDLDGFSGAGLYDTVPNVHGAAAVGAAVKKVWASVWNLAAYEEREHYRVDHREVYGAVLVQIGIAATAAGVLVTAHPTDPKNQHTIQINAKSGLGMRVVDGKKLPEIVLYNTRNRGLRVVSRSDEDTMLVFAQDGGVREIPNPKKSEPILTNARVTKLAAAAMKLRDVFPKGRPLDIEWVLRDDDVFIVQSRPFMGAPQR